MKKLIKGIIQHRNEVGKSQLGTLGKLAVEQKPDALFIACSDSRIVPNLFTSTNPGDLFVVRNIGNIIPPSDRNGFSGGDMSELAAIEYATQILGVKDIIVCGHSECGAMSALLDMNSVASHQHLSKWIKFAIQSKHKLEKERHKYSSDLSKTNVLSQINVLQQISHLKTYPFIRNKMDNGQIALHAWWFDITTASVYSYDAHSERFEILK